MEHTMRMRHNFTRTVLTVAALALVASGATVASSDAADVSVTSSNRTVGQVGDVDTVAAVKVRCEDLWMNTHTRRDEDRCRDKGWVISWRFNLSPHHHRIWTGYPACRSEDSTRCYWNARLEGNGYGDSFLNMGRHGIIRHLWWINDSAAAELGSPHIQP